MTNKPRQTGTRFEGECKTFLLSFFPDVDREDFSSPLGDLKGTPATIECKDRKALTLSEFMGQVKKSDEKTQRDMPIIICKRRNHNIRDAYAITDFEHMRTLLKCFEICQKKGLI